MPLIIFVLAIAFFSIHLVMANKRMSTEHKMELFMRYLFFFLVGLQSLFSSIAHLFYPDQTAQIIGWETSPFQFEIGMINLSFAVLGILAIWLRKGFWIALIVGYTIWLWGAGIGHIEDLMKTGRGNISVYFYSDLIAPFVLILTFLFYIQSIKGVVSWKGKWNHFINH